MGRTKDKHLRQERDRGQGYDRALIGRDPEHMSTDDLKVELKKRGLSTEGKQRHLRGRLIRALCVGLKPITKKQKLDNQPDGRDSSGKTIWFEAPDCPAAEDYLTLEEKGKTIRYNDIDKPSWCTVRAAHPIPDETTLKWSFLLQQQYNVVIGVAREDVDPESMLGSDTTGYGYFTTLGSKHHNDKSGAGEAYGDMCKSGDKVDVIMDTKSGTLSFAHNGKQLGEAFTGIYGTVYPAVSVCGLCKLMCGKEVVLSEPNLASSSSSATSSAENPSSGSSASAANAGGTIEPEAAAPAASPSAPTNPK